MTEKRSVFGQVKKSPPPKIKNSQVRTREHLTPEEIAQVLKAAKSGREGIRNYCLLLLIYRHGLRCCEALALKWEAIDFKQAEIYIKRAKGSADSVQPIYPDEIKALRDLQRQGQKSLYIFLSERGQPLSDKRVRTIVAAAGEAAKLPFPIHTHMLRHSTGYYLANRGTDSRHIQQYLGHRNYRHTEHYTALSPKPFKNLWDD